jgi:F-type H+-transporting ATPase subunit b
MLIDWFTVAAQAINFFLLVWLLKRYLYKPILHAIDVREQRVDAQLNDAAAQQVKAKTERDIFQKKNEKFDQQSAKLMQQARDAAASEQQRLIKDAQQKAKAKRVQYKQSLAMDVYNLKQALSRKATQEVFAIARKALKDLASTSLEEQVVDVFVKTLNEIDSSKKSTLANALKATSLSEPAIVRSAFELEEIERTKIQQAIKQTFAIDVALKFETKLELVSGIELSANGQRLVWSIDDYLLTLEQNIAALLKETKQAIEQSDVQSAKPASSKKSSETDTPEKPAIGGQNEQ